MKILSGLEGTASAFAGQAIQGLAIQRAAKNWGIFKREQETVEEKQSDGSNKSIPVYEAGITRGAPEKAYGYKRILGASHVETLSINKGSTISDAPQEKGAFLSYDKVQRPYQFEIRMICDGSDTGNLWENMLPGFVRGLINDGKDGADALKKAFIERLDEAVASTDLYWVSTPEKLYQHINIIGYRIHRGLDGSSDMLVADITLQEVRDASTTGKLKGKHPQGDPKHNNGTVQPKPMPDASAGEKA